MALNITVELDFPENRAPRHGRPKIIFLKRGHIMSASEVTKNLVRRFNRGEEGGLPPLLPRAFVEDLAEWSAAVVNSQYGWPQDRAEYNFQEDLCEHWPASWMLWVFNNVGCLQYKKESK